MKDLTDTPLDALDLDEAARPDARPLPGATDAHRRAGRHLAVIHRHYLMDLARVAAVFERIETGDAPPEALARIVLSLDMAENYRAFGSLCGQECHVLRMHHDIEEASMFPGLEARGGAGLKSIVAKLRQEHTVVHELIERLAAAAEQLSRDPGPEQFAEAGRIFRKLKDVVASHFGYEETALEEAIGVYLGEI